MERIEPKYYPRTGVQIQYPSVETREYAAAKAALAAIRNSVNRSRAQFEALVNQRLAYELRFPAAIPYAPRIPKWQDAPVESNLKDR